MQLNFDNVYSKFVCSSCDDQLKNFSILQKDFITKQIKLQKFVSDSEEKLKRKEVDVKSEAVVMKSLTTKMNRSNASDSEENQRSTKVQ